MFGIAWGIVSITLMVAAGEGLRVGQAKVAEQFGKDILIVFAGRTSMQAGGARAGRQIRWDGRRPRIAQEQSPSCATSMPELGQGDTPVRSAYNSGALLVTGSLPPFGDIRSITVAEGRWPTWEDETRGAAASPSWAATRRSSCSAAARRWAKPSGSATSRTPSSASCSTRSRTRATTAGTSRRCSSRSPPSLRDFPNKPPAIPDSVDRLLVSPRSVAQHDDCKREVRTALGRAPRLRPHATRKRPASGTRSRRRRRSAR